MEEVSESLAQMLVDNVHARRMNSAENFFAICQRQRLYTTFSLMVEFNQKVNDRALLYHAIRNIMLKNPILCITVVDSDHSDLSVVKPQHDYLKVLDELKFKDLFLDPPIDVDIVHNKGEFFRKLNDIEIPYGHENTIWKLMILDDYNIVFIANHVALDGISAKHFMQDLQKQLCIMDPTIIMEKDVNYDEELILNYQRDKSKIPKLPKSFDQIVPHNPPFWYIPEFLWNTFFTKRWVWKTSIPSRNESHNHSIINITPEQLQTIKSKTREKAVTLTPYIEIAWLVSQYQIGLFENWSYTDLIVAVDSRIYLPQDIDKDLYRYGLLASSFHTYIPIIKKFLWSKVQQYTNYNQWCVRTKRALFRLGIISSSKIVAKGGQINMDKVLKDTLLNNPKGNTLFSNLGFIMDNGIECGDKFKLQNAYFTQHMNGNYFTFCLNCVTTANGGMNIIYSVPEKDLSQNKLDELTRKFKENLINGCIDN